MLKSKLVIAASLAVVSYGALADAPNFIPDWELHSTSTLTRAQVLADLEQARARGEVMQGDGTFPVVNTPSTRSRREVQAELREAQRLGLTERSESVGPFGTPEQEAQIARAGAAAAGEERRLAASSSDAH